MNTSYHVFCIIDLWKLRDAYCGFGYTVLRGLTKKDDDEKQTFNKKQT